MTASSTRWKPGQSGNPKGRPKRVKEAAYLRALNELVSLETWGRIIERAIKDAEDGDHKAREWLSKYLIGEPKNVDAVEMSGDLQILFGHGADTESEEA